MSDFFSSLSLEKLLIVFVVLWITQGIGVWFQSRSYTSEMKKLQGNSSLGFLGVGHSRRRWRAGSIVMIVTDINLKVSKFRLMRGITIFTKFADQPEFVDLGLDDLQKQLEKEPEKSSLRIAGVGAINQILRVKRDREQKALSAAPALNPA